MERIEPARAAKSLVAQQSVESSAASPQSTGRLNSSDGRELATMVGQMVAYYPHQEMGAETVAGYMHDLSRLAMKHSLPAVKTALLTLRIRPGQKFFPHPSEVAEELEAMATKAREEARTQNPYVPDPECKHLLPGQAWVVDKDGDRVLGRCECWKRWKGQLPVKDHKAAATGK
jgi:hypothetical protein